MRTTILAAHLSAAISAVASTATYGHHSDALYDYSRSVSLPGVVQRFRWVNPHVNIQLLVAGEAWTIEAEPPAVLARFGWSRNTMNVGDSVTVNAIPAKDPKRKMAFGVSAVTADGLHLWISGATPYDKESEEPAILVPAKGLSGVWATRFNPDAFVEYFHREQSDALTQAGNSSLANADDEIPNGMECTPRPAPYPLLTPILVEIETGPDTTYVRFESDQGLVERSVNMGVEAHNFSEPSNQGHSIGHWEGDVLIVDTTQFAVHPYGHARGLPSSPHKHLIERFELSIDRTILHYQFRVEDPVYLAEPAVADLELFHRPDLAIQDIPCDLESARKYLE